VSTYAMSTLSTAGRLTIPQKMRTHLGIRTGGKVMLQEVADGVIILSTLQLSRPQIAEQMLLGLVKGIGQAAEKMGIREEEDLDPVIEAIRERTFGERYGTLDASKGVR